MKHELRSSSEIFAPQPFRPETSREFQLLTLDELNQLPDPESLVGPFLRRSGLSVAFGPPKSGKTFLLLDMALRVSAGIPWHDGTPTNPAPVLWVAGEGATSIKRRAACWCAANGIDRPEGFRVIRGPVNLFSGEGSELRMYLEAVGFRPSVIVLDTFARCTTGADENRAGDVQQIIDEVYGLTERLGANVTLIHHSGKEPRGPRGSSALMAAADQVFRISKRGKRLRVESVAERDCEPFDDLEFDLEQVDRSLVVKPAESLGREGLTPEEEELLSVFKSHDPFGWMTAAQINSELGWADSTLGRRLGSLVEKGVLEEKVLTEPGNPKAYRILGPDGQEEDSFSPDRPRKAFPPPPTPSIEGGGGGGNTLAEGCLQ